MCTFFPSSHHSRIRVFSHSIFNHIQKVSHAHWFHDEPHEHIAVILWTFLPSAELLGFCIHFRSIVYVACAYRYEEAVSYLRHTCSPLQSSRELLCVCVWMWLVCLVLMRGIRKDCCYFYKWRVVLCAPVVSGSVSHLSNKRVRHTLNIITLSCRIIYMLWGKKRWRNVNVNTNNAIKCKYK